MILGIILGFALTLLLVGHRIDHLMNRYSILERELRQSKEKITQLEGEIEQKDKDWREKEQLKIKSIIINVEGITSTSIELALEESIYELVKDLIGRPIDEIDPFITEKSLDYRLMESNERIFEIKIIRSLYSTETTFWIDAVKKE